MTQEELNTLKGIAEQMDRNTERLIEDDRRIKEIINKLREPLPPAKPTITVTDILINIALIIAILSLFSVLILTVMQMRQ